MNLILVLVTWYLYYIQIIDSKRYSMIVDDELLPYTIEKGVPPISEYFVTDHLIFEQIADDKVEFSLRSQYLYQSSWREGPLRIILVDFCPEFLNPSRFWYNITKLWTNCPPQMGDKWFIETQIVDISFDLPPSIPIGKWRLCMLHTQGLLGSVAKLGYMINMEFIYI